MAYFSGHCARLGYSLFIVHGAELLGSPERNPLIFVTASLFPS